MTTKRKISARMLARDVLKLMGAKKIIPKSGNYFDLASNVQSDDLKSAIKENGFKCQVCALGAALVAHTSRANDVTVHGANFEFACNLGGVIDVLGKEQMGLIESAFERSSSVGLAYQNPNTYLSSEVEAAVAFGERYASDRGRLVGIMKNIEKHGKFDPTAGRRSKVTV